MISSHLSLWRNRNYAVLVGGQIISLVGSRISEIALPLLVLSISRSPAETGLIGAASGLPYPFLGSLAGALVDRWDRKRIMLVCEASNIKKDITT